MGGPDSIELSAASLAVSKGLHVGSGVFRPLEHDLNQLTRRLVTLQLLSENRYVLGIGTGQPGQNPASKINDLLKRLEEIRNAFSEKSMSFPETFVATLRPGIARKVARKTDGILLNFCPPEFARGVVEAVERVFSGNIEKACYMKCFFSQSEETATRLAIEEFVKYDMLGHYHEMFEKSGLSQEIQTASRSLQGTNLYYPEKLSRTCPVNPDLDELRRYVSDFRRAGITLPCLYPYFAPHENFEFKYQTAGSITAASE